MFRRLLLLFLLSLLTFIPRSQLQHNQDAYLEIYRDAEKLYNDADANETSDSAALLKYLQVIEILQKASLNDSILFNSYTRCGILLTAQKKDTESLQNLFSAIKLNQQSGILADSLSFLPWVFAGSNYYNTYNPDSALYCYKQAEKIYALHSKLAEAERLFNKTGVLYYEEGDYKKSIIYFSKAASLVDSTASGYAYFIVNYKNNIASAYRKLQQYDKALEIYKSLIPYQIYTDEVLHNIGVTYLDAGNYTQAVYYLKQVAYTNAGKYNDLASAYLKLKDYNNAALNINAALKTYHLPVLQRNPQYAGTLKLSGDLLMAKVDPDAALVKYQSAILQTVPGFKDSSTSKNPTAFGGLNHYFFLFDVLAAKAHAFEATYQFNNSRIELLKNAFSTYGAALSLAGYMEKIYGSDESKLFLKKNVEPVYKTTVEAGLQLFELTKDSSYLNQVFHYIENSKASVLQANLYDMELSSIKGMPVQLLQEERKLKSILAGLNLQASQIKDSIKTMALENQIQETALQLAHVQEQLNENPNYYRLKFGEPGENIEGIRDKLLQDDETILSYYNTGKHLLCYYINKQQYGYVSAPLNADLRDEIKQLRTLLSSPDGGDNKSLETLGTSLYRQLIEPVVSKIKHAKHLVIIPYNEISYVPFEMLSAPINHHLLIEDYAISYQYSANFLNGKKSSTDAYKVLAMAPFTQVSAGKSLLPQLPASLSEVEDLPGTILQDKRATKNAFIKLAPAYPVIHLATHARADDSLPEQSYISFYDRDLNADSSVRLYEPEIYHLDLSKTRLAILSACETGEGRIINSEGIISLSRAFSYAGCKSVITSLWKANDIATAFITKKLHHYLQTGYAVDEALQKAKLDYLVSGDIESRFKKPAYWANLIITGDAHAITAKKLNWYLIATGILILLAVAVYKKKAVYRK